MLFFDDFTPTETVPYMPTKTFRAIRDNNPKGIYMQKKMKHKIYKLATSFWFALQGLIMISWTSYLYINEKQQNTEIFVLGCVLLVIAVLFNLKSNVIKKICCGFLLLYSICTAIIGWLLISVASPTREAFWIIVLIIIANMIPTAHYCFSQEEK